MFVVFCVSLGQSPCRRAFLEECTGVLLCIFPPHTVNPHFFLPIIAKVKLHAVKAYEGVKE